MDMHKANFTEVKESIIKTIKDNVMSLRTLHLKADSLKIDEYVNILVKIKSAFGRIDRVILENPSMLTKPIIDAISQLAHEQKNFIRVEIFNRSNTS